MTYINYQEKISADVNSSTWFWEDEGLEVIDTDLKWTVSQVIYYGYKISLSQVVPIKAYNQTAYSVVAETNFADDFVFHTEKIVKPILARRLFIVFGGHQYLKNLRQLGFKTFNNIIGFVERKDTSMVFKTKVTIFTPEIKRVQTGRICDEAVKKVQTELLNFIEDIMHNQNCNIEHYTGFVFTKLSTLINKID
jgi:hypothetical protein